MTIKANVELSLEPFMTPNHVRISPDGTNAISIATLPLKEIDANTLDRLCEQFRTDVFNKAGKSQPDRSAK
jgi:hypothetical protein